MNKFVIVVYSLDTQTGLDTTCVEADDVDAARDKAEEAGFDVYGAYSLELADPALQAKYR